MNNSSAERHPPSAGGPSREVRPRDTTPPGLPAAHEAEYGRRAIEYERAFDLAIPAVLTHETGESPRALVKEFAEAEGHPLTKEELDEKMRELVAAGSFELLPVDETNENEDDPRQNWIFQVSVETGSDHGFWASVDRNSGQVEVSGFN